MASQYDAAGDRTRLTWPDGFYVVYTYDVLGEMTAVEENGATSGPGLLASLAYDNLGRRTTLTRGNGVVTSYGYDTASRLSSVAHSLPTSSQNQTETYAYSVANQVITKTSSNDGWAWNGAYNVNRNYTANGLNEQITSGANTLTWAAKGDLTGDGTLTYSYDTNNYLFAASNGSSQMYDGSGRLYSVGASAATRFAYDGDLAIAEYNSSGSVLRRFVPGAGEDEPLVWYEGSGTITRYGLTADRLGSITGVTTDAGATAAINSYDEYGLPGTANTGRYQYTGQKYLSEFGMYDYKARNYAPTLGRFVQPDPIGYGDGLNIYQYVHSDPYNQRDPAGLAANIVCSDQGNGYAECTITDGGPDDGTSSSVSFGNNDPTGGAARALQNRACAAALKAAAKTSAAVTRANNNMSVLSQAASANNIDPSLLAAVGVRETGFQNVPQAGGGGGMGVFQLTNQKGVTPAQAYSLPFAANFAAGLLSSNMQMLATAFPNLSPSQLLQATAASYNFGVSNISGNPRTIDVGTTGGNYGSNVVDLMTCFQN